MRRTELNARMPVAPPELLQLHKEEKRLSRGSDSTRLRLIERLGLHSEMKEVWHNLLNKHRRFKPALGHSRNSGRTEKGLAGKEDQVRAVQVRELIEACEKAQDIFSLIDLIGSTETRKRYKKVARTAAVLSDLVAEIHEEIDEKLKTGLSSEVAEKKPGKIISKVIDRLHNRVDYSLDQLATLERDFGVPAPVVRAAFFTVLLTEHLRSIGTIARYAQSPMGQTWKANDAQRTARLHFQLELWGYFNRAYGSGLYDCIAGITKAVFFNKEANRSVNANAVAIRRAIERYMRTNSA